VIYDAVIVPHESPPTLREIKRALLTFDKTLVVDPSDRELIPRNAFMAAILGIPLFGLDVGPVRPLGKTLGHDERFDRTLDACKAAVDLGLLEVRSTYVAQPQGQITVGGVPTGGYPLVPAAVYQLYRGMASSQDYLTCALQRQIPQLEQAILVSPGLALSGGADGSTNGGPTLPIAAAAASSAQAEALTQVARGRISAFIKYAGYCEAKSMVPLFNAEIYAGIAATLFSRTREFLKACDEDGAYVRRSRILNLVHDEYLLDERLDGLSIPDVIKLRTRAWGMQASAREQLFQSVFEIADIAGSDADFALRATDQIRRYRQESEELLREREALSIEIKCDLGEATLAGGVALTGLLTQLESPIQSIGLTLAAGAVWGLERAKEYVPRLRELQAQNSGLKRGAGFALHNFYSALPKANQSSG
jgi:hypothetical protein